MEYFDIEDEVALTDVGLELQLCDESDDQSDNEQTEDDFNDECAIYSESDEVDYESS